MAKKLQLSYKEIEERLKVFKNGSIRPEESMITEDAGFDKIHTLKEGESPLDYIERIDDEYYRKMKK